MPLNYWEGPLPLLQGKAAFCNGPCFCVRVKQGLIVISSAALWEPDEIVPSISTELGMGWAALDGQTAPACSRDVSSFGLTQGKPLPIWSDPPWHIPETTLGNKTSPAEALKIHTQPYLYQIGFSRAAVGVMTVPVPFKEGLGRPKLHPL